MCESRSSRRKRRRAVCTVHLQMQIGRKICSLSLPGARSRRGLPLWIHMDDNSAGAFCKEAVGTNSTLGYVRLDFSAPPKHAGGSGGQSYDDGKA